jgi:hypothetical protein
MRERCERTAVEGCRTSPVGRLISAQSGGIVGRRQVGSGYRMGLQVGGRGFESRTLQSPENPICRTSLGSVSTAGNSGASAVRADRR